MAITAALAVATLAPSPSALADTYVAWARSDDATVFTPVLGELDTSPEGGLPHALVGAVAMSADGKHAAVEIGGDVLLADATTGTPKAWVTGATTAGLSFVETSAVFAHAVVDLRDGRVDIEGTFVARHGERAHVVDSVSLEPDRPEAPSAVRLRVWDLRRHRLVLERRRLTTPEEDDSTVLVPNEVGSSSTALVTPHGLWNVHTGRFTKFEPDASRAVRADGRYMARVRSEGRIEDGSFRANLVEIVDLARGSIVRARLDTSMLSNGSPFSFTDGDRLVVSDYSRWIIDLVSGRVVRDASGQEPALPASEPPRRAPAEMEVLERIDRGSCHAGGLVLPRAVCFSDTPRPGNGAPPAHPDRGAHRRPSAPRTSAAAFAMVTARSRSSAARPP